MAVDSHIYTSASGEWKSYWKLTLAASAGMSLAALSHSIIGVMIEPMEQSLNWSRTQIVLGPSILAGIMMIGAPPMGFVIDRLGVRLIAALAAALLCASIAMMGQVGSSSWSWWACWIFAGLASTAMPAVWVTPVVSAFTASRGLALAVVLSGAGLSSTLGPPLTNYLVEHYGWREAYTVLGILWALFVLPLVLLFLYDPRKARLPETDGRADRPVVQPSGLTVRESLHSPAFFKIAIASIMSTFATVAITMNIVPLLRSIDVSVTTAASVAGLLGLSSFFGRLGSGWLMDKVGANMIALVATFGMVILPAALLFAPGSITILSTSVVIFGVLGGAKLPLIAYLTRAHFGDRSFASLYATIHACLTASVVLGPLLASYAYDQVKSYDLVLWATFPSLALAAVLYYQLGPSPDFPGEPR